MKDWKLPWEGGCRCGQVRLKITAPPLLTLACHCKGCQRMSASAFSLGMLLPSDGFQVTQGEPVIGGLHGAVRHFFCPHCMSWMWNRPPGVETIVIVRPTMLDDPSWFWPFLETCTREKLPWASTPAVHGFEGFPDPADYGRLMKEFADRAEEGFKPPAKAPARAPVA
ncbi:GFA family protein [Polyangium sp. 6x1]|uniref:GFA family protein n=1 Tax=Polyangium sp. 6x1 TaxID=3042689 RepID=UPI002483112F|nr:GFA family protein [Polyangium sp. 6x1]MDI1446678.1 GFA family protein [Polyangium sp. 6x1]